MKNTQTVLEWIQEMFPKKAPFDFTFAAKQVYPELVVMDELGIQKVFAWLNSPAESVYMGEVGSLLLELRKEL